MRLARRLHHHGPRYCNFPYFFILCGLEKLGLVFKMTGAWSVYLSVLLLRTLAVGKRQRSESIEVAVEMG